MSRARVLIVQELWWPKGGGGILATHLITKVLVRHGFEVRVVTGVEDHEVIDNVVFIHEPRLRAGNKLELWFNAYMVSREGWFRKLVEWADVVYIPHYAYPVIPSDCERGVSSSLYCQIIYEGLRRGVAVVEGWRDQGYGQHYRYEGHAKGYERPSGAHPSRHRCVTLQTLKAG